MSDYPDNAKYLLKDKRGRALARKMDETYRSIRAWHPIDNPSGPTGTLAQRRVQKMLITLQAVEADLLEWLS